MSQAHDSYYVPHGSHWPIVGSVGLLFLMLGASTWLNGADAGFWVMLTGAAIIVFMLAGWFGTVISESVGGLYNEQVDKSFRMGMFWFIFSEVMFLRHFSARCSMRETCRFPGSVEAAIVFSPTCCSGMASKAPGRRTDQARPVRARRDSP